MNFPMRCSAFRNDQPAAKLDRNIQISMLDRPEIARCAITLADSNAAP
jgi:hypothetical protein